ncbi:MAG: 1-phosphofructokinase family hexose kinase [Roseiarcus sp.]
MARVLTITMNPSIDISTSVDRVQPTRKLRCAPARRDPGGGGVNVARVANRLGNEAIAVYPAGGSCGERLHKLIDQENIRGLAIPIEEETREDFTVVETSTGHEYRFVSIGPRLSETEWRNCLDAVAAFRDPVDVIVASGSLAPGVPDDFYAWIAKIARGRSAPFALDTSGPPLRAALDHGVDLLKPSLGELRELTGQLLASPAACVAACRKLVEAGQAKAVALTLGSQGAILATQEGAWRAWPLPIHAVSTVGAGDSFLAAMVCAQASGLPPLEAFRHGVAAGSAALLSPGTQLCRAEDVRELLAHVAVDRAA